jgi:hypothetical protein
MARQCARGVYSFSTGGGHRGDYNSFGHFPSLFEIPAAVRTGAAGIPDESRCSPIHGRYVSIFANAGLLAPNLNSDEIH